MTCCGDRPGEHGPAAGAADVGAANVGAIEQNFRGFLDAANSPGALGGADEAGHGDCAFGPGPLYPLPEVPCRQGPRGGVFAGGNRRSRLDGDRVRRLAGNDVLPRQSLQPLKSPLIGVRVVTAAATSPPVPGVAGKSVVLALRESINYPPIGHRL